MTILKPCFDSQPHIDQMFLSLFSTQAPWNPVHNAQAIARIHRMGQTRPTYVYWLLYKNTIVREN